VNDGLPEKTKSLVYETFGDIFYTIGLGDSLRKTNERFELTDSDSVTISPNAALSIVRAQLLIFLNKKRAGFLCEYGAESSGELYIAVAAPW